jgi:hypothetical protein
MLNPSTDGYKSGVPVAHRIYHCFFRKSELVAIMAVALPAEIAAFFSKVAYLIYHITREDKGISTHCALFVSIKIVAAPVSV